MLFLYIKCTTTSLTSQMHMEDWKKFQSRTTSSKIASDNDYLDQV